MASFADVQMPIELERGVATIPLKGIDVPFHSSHLQNSVPAYRKFLQQQISEGNLQVDKVVGKYIPNLLAKPFSVEKDYLEEAYDLTKSEVLRELIELVA